MTLLYMDLPGQRPQDFFPKPAVIIRPRGSVDIMTFRPCDLIRANESMNR